MLKEAIDLQQKAVSDLLSLLQQKDELVFKSPTGSGKTYMMADLMNRVLSNNSDVVFLVSTLSKGDLAKQNYNKFCEYSLSGNFTNLNPFLISSEVSEEERLFIPTDYNVYLLPRDLFKKNGRLMKGPMDEFLTSLTLDHYFGGCGKKIYLIKDECHIATNNLDSLSDSLFTKSLNFSATPNLKRGQNPDVEIQDIDAVNAKLIKRVEFGDENDSVLDAISKFENIKKSYRDLLGVNPCLIIQISNKDKADDELKIIMSVLNRNEYQDLKWMLIVNDDKKCDTNDVFKAKKMSVDKWKDYAKESTATIDIIIFKMVISEGWDIPRACMLYQVRDSQSLQLDEQVMGRVRRNPKLLNFEDLSEEAKKLATTAWVWGIPPKSSKHFYKVKLADEPEDIQNEIKIKTTKIKLLSEKKDFDLEEFIKNQSITQSYSSIFKLYKKLNKCEDSIKTMCYKFSEDFTKWLKFNDNLDEIILETNKFACDYNDSMELNKNENNEDKFVSFPIISNYLDNGNYINISDWVWCRKDGKDKFSFDSDAEREWATIIKDLCSKNIVNSNNRIVKEVETGKNNPNFGRIDLLGNIEPKKFNSTYKYLWGKNYIYNSEIKFEYYLNGIHSSYPDFIMKDSFNRIHIFEVKSVNFSNELSNKIDKQSYIEKIEELKKCYKHASKLTKHIFYLPILKDDIWYITQFLDGNEKVITKEQFVAFVSNK